MLDGALRHALYVQGPLEGQSHFRPDKSVLPQTLLLAASTAEVRSLAASKARACAGCRRCLLPLICYRSRPGGPLSALLVCTAATDCTEVGPADLASASWKLPQHAMPPVPYMSEYQGWDSR